MNKFNIISLISGLVAMIFNLYGIPALIAVTTGYIYIKKNPKSPNKIAILGIGLGIFSFIWIIYNLIF